MRIPQNFNKIDGTKFTIGADEFLIEADNQQHGDCWVTNSNGLKWPLCFDIDWVNEKYALIKCEPGQGRRGNVLATDAILMKYLMKDANTFVNSFLKDVVSTLIKNNLI